VHDDVPHSLLSLLSRCPSGGAKPPGGELERSVDLAVESVKGPLSVDFLWSFITSLPMWTGSAPREGVRVWMLRGGWYGIVWVRESRGSRSSGGNGRNWGKLFLGAMMLDEVRVSL
jgi:hypothetical protein